MKTKIFSALIALALFMPLCSNTVFSQNPNEQKHDRIPGLTDDQKAKIKEIRTASMKEILPLKNELREKEAHLQTLTSGNADLNQIYKAIDEISVLKNSIAKKHAATQFNIRQFLNDEQKLYLDSHPRDRKHRERKQD